MIEDKHKTEDRRVADEQGDQPIASPPVAPETSKPKPDGDAIADLGDAVGGPA